MSEEQTRQLTPVMRATVGALAERMSLQVDAEALMGTLMSTVFADTSGATQADLALVLHVANKHNLDPITREIYAFKANGRVLPIVGVDGWYKIANSHPQFDGLEFEYTDSPDGELVSVTCRVFRKDRKHAIEATEFLSECQKGTEPWKKWPRRMLRHKAAIQAFRMAFGFAGFYEPDEAERIIESSPDDIDTTVVDSTPITDEQYTALNHAISAAFDLTDGNIRADATAFVGRLKEAFGIDQLDELPSDQFDACLARIGDAAKFRNDNAFDQPKTDDEIPGYTPAS